MGTKGGGKSRDWDEGRVWTKGGGKVWEQREEGVDEMSCCSGHAWERCEGEGLVTREDIGIARGEPVRVG